MITVCVLKTFSVCDPNQARFYELLLLITPPFFNLAYNSIIIIIMIFFSK